jgi:hypothetical protein
VVFVLMDDLVGFLLGLSLYAVARQVAKSCPKAIQVSRHYPALPGFAFTPKDGAFPALAANDLLSGTQ